MTAQIIIADPGMPGIFGGAPSAPAWVPAGATTVFDFENARSYFAGTIDTLANDAANYIVTGNSQTNIVAVAGDLRANVTWSQGGLQNSGAGILAPDGTNSAWKIEEQATLERHVLYPIGFAPYTIAAGSTISGLFVIKAAERDYAVAGVQDVAFNGFYAYVDLINGTIAPGAFGTGALIDSVITALGDGWYMIVLTGTVDPAATGALPTLDTSLTLGNQNYQGEAGFGIYAWTVQLVSGAVATIPMPAIGLTMTAQPTTELMGTVWTQLPLTGDNALRIVGNVLTNAATVGQQAGYFNVNENKGQTIARIGSRFELTQIGAGLNGAATLAVWKTQPVTTAAPPNSGCHLAMGRTSWVYGKIIDGNPVEPIDSGVYDLAPDTPLEASIVFDYPNSRANVTLPNGEARVITDPAISSEAGRWGTFEAFQSDAAADDRTGFLKTWIG